jgi:hypothetical protein
MQYQAELVKRGLIKPGDEVPSVVVDKARKEVLHVGSDNPEEMTKLTDAAIAAANDLLGIKSQRLLGKDLEYAVKNWAVENKVQTGRHYDTSSQKLERLENISFTNTTDSLEALRYAARKGKFKSFETEISADTL